MAAALERRRRARPARVPPLRRGALLAGADGRRLRRRLPDGDRRRAGLRLPPALAVRPRDPAPRRAGARLARRRAALRARGHGDRRPPRPLAARRARARGDRADGRSSRSSTSSSTGRRRRSRARRARARRTLADALGVQAALALARRSAWASPRSRSRSRRAVVAAFGGEGRDRRASPSPTCGSPRSACRSPSSRSARQGYLRGVSATCARRC